MKSVERRIEKLNWKAGQSARIGYLQDNTNGDEDDRRKGI